MRPGRPAVTSKGELELVALELFAERGFDETTVGQIAEAAGIGRRTFFRYFASKNDVVWGDFDRALEDFRARLLAVPDSTSLIEGLTDAVIAFNALPRGAEPQHRVRMAMVLHTPALQAHSTLRYAGWRAVVAEYAARRLGQQPTDFEPQLLAHHALASCVAAYEEWLSQAHRTGTDRNLKGLLRRALAPLATAW